MKFLRILAVVVLWAAPAAAQVSVSGNLRDISGTIVTSNAEVDFELQNYRGLIPRVSGTTTIAQVKKVFKPDTNGVIHCVGVGCTDTVYQNSVISPVGTFYSVCIIIKGQTLRCNNYLINSPFDLNSATPLNASQNVGPGSTLTQCFVFIQASPATTWTITHNLNDLNVFIETSDLNGIEIALPVGGADIHQSNVAVINWGAPQAGRALVCHAGQVINPSFLSSVAPNPAQSGFLRLATADNICWRNLANTLDYCISKTASDALLLNSFPIVNLPQAVAGSFTGTNPLQAASGLYRLESGGAMCWRNAGNTADLCFGKDSSDFFNLAGLALFVGGTSSATAVKITPNTITGVADSIFLVQSTRSVAANGPATYVQASNSDGSNGSSGGGVAFFAGAGGSPGGFGGNVTLIAGTGSGAGGAGGSIILTPGSNGTGPRGTTTMTAGFLFYPPAFTFIGLGTPADGALVFCTNCTIANPCASGGTGAIAKRLNGVWVCN